MSNPAYPATVSRSASSVWPSRPLTQHNVTASPSMDVCQKGKREISKKERIAIIKSTAGQILRHYKFSDQGIIRVYKDAPDGINLLDGEGNTVQFFSYVDPEKDDPELEDNVSRFTSSETDGTEICGIEFPRSMFGSNAPVAVYFMSKTAKDAFVESNMNGGSEITITLVDKEGRGMPTKFHPPSNEGPILILKYIGEAALTSGLAIFITSLTTFSWNPILLAIGLLLVILGTLALCVYGYSVGHNV